MLWPTGLLALLLATQSATAQTNYFVDNANGNDLNNGTSLATAWKTIKKACNAATPNSIVQIKAGTYNENVVVNVSGTAGNPITFKNYNNDTVIIDGTGTSGTTLLTIKNKQYLNFENLTLQNLTKNNAQGILVESAASTTTPVTTLLFKNITVRNINWNSSRTKTPGSNNNAQPFIAYGRGTTADRAITNLVIDSCTFYNNITGYSESLSLDGNIDGFTIKNCLVHDNVNIGIYAGGNYGECSVPALDHTRDGTIENNTCYNNVAFYATSGGIYADGSKNVVIRRNICYGNGYGVEIGCEENGTTENITLIDNLIYANDDAGIAVGGYTTETTGQVLGCTIRNNTLFENDNGQNGSGELYITKASNCSFENNVLYANSQEILMSLENISPQTGNVFNYNCWYSPSGNPNNITVQWRATQYSSFSSYKTGASQDANSLYGNPRLTNPVLPNPNLYPLSGSPCINAGDPSTVLVTGETDYAGHARVVGIIDIGAYESDSAATVISKAVQGYAAAAAGSVSPASVYPNPFGSQTTVYLKTELQDGELTIWDATGKIVREVRNITGWQIRIDRNDLRSGVYFYTIRKGNNRVAAGKLLVE